MADDKIGSNNQAFLGVGRKDNGSQGKAVHVHVASTSADTSGATSAAIAHDLGSEPGEEQGVPAAAGLRLCGFSMMAELADAATVIIHHGTSNAGPVLASVRLAAGESAREWFGNAGIDAASGIFVERTEGAAHVIIYAKVVS